MTLDRNIFRSDIEYIFSSSINLIGISFITLLKQGGYKLVIVIDTKIETKLL